MNDESTSVLKGLSIWAGVVLFAIVNLVVGVIANPHFPNEKGPMPGWLPYGVLALVGVLLAGAVMHAGWRRVAAGFVLGYGGMALAFGGELTTSFDQAAGTLLFPTPAPRPPESPYAQRDREIARDLRAVRADAPSPAVLAKLARDAFAAAGCAFAYREGHPTDGFPATLKELIGAGPGCRSLVPFVTRSRVLQVSFSPQVRRPGEPVTQLSLALAPEVPDSGGGYPRYTVDASGIVMSQFAAGSAAFAVASPVPALLQLRECLRAATWPAAPDSLPGLSALLGTAPRCEALAREVRDEPRGGTGRAVLALTLCIRVDWRPACDDGDVVASYLVRYIRTGARPEAFILRAAAQGEGAPMRRYLVTRDGAVHATGEPRDAKEGDPVVERCELDPGVPCG